jgi:hypothetical protein
MKGNLDSESVCRGRRWNLQWNRREQGSGEQMKCPGELNGTRK